MNEGMISKSNLYATTASQKQIYRGYIDTVSAQSHRPRDRSRGRDEKLASVNWLGMQAAWSIFCAIGVVVGISRPSFY